MHEITVYQDQIYTQDAEAPMSWQRAAAFGDGLFETMMWRKGVLQFWPRHCQRIARGLGLLNIEPDVHAWEAALLKVQPYMPPTARIRLSVWRRGNGTYGSQERGSDFLIQVVPLQRDGYCQHEAMKLTVATTPVPNHALAAYKTLSAISYVLASNEATRNKAHQAVMLDARGWIAETNVANLYALKGETLYTPRGGVAGIQQSVLTENPLPGWQVQQADISPSELFKYDAVWVSNSVMGLGEAISLDQRKLHRNAPNLVHWCRHLLALCELEATFV
ncbi:MAG: aminotransferase class IV [Bacteroidetes bacterium]|jgi:branched-subunit amino acid aminotransferase/4-amino-4-deoxychorismate lyase|nr:aminotransferase class IV [Bacteroidota bacterium]